MILIDNTQIILSSIFSQYKGPDEVNEDMIRHITLNTYRYYRKRFYEEYGELVICQDAGNYWRKDIFPPAAYRDLLPATQSSLAGV